MSDWLEQNLVKAAHRGDAGENPGSQHLIYEVQKAVLFAVFLYGLHALSTRRKDLKAAPGPLITAWTNIYRFPVVCRRRVHLETIELHKKYGRYVCLGAKFLPISDAAAVPAIYGVAKGLSKSKFYDAVDVEVDGKLMQRAFAHATLIGRDLDWHRSLRKPVANAYAMPMLISHEPLVASTTEYFLDIIRCKFGKTDNVCDLLKRIQWCAFDVTGEITFSERVGFLEQGRDLDDICKAIDESFHTVHQSVTRVYEALPTQ